MRSKFIKKKKKSAPLWSGFVNTAMKIVIRLDLMRNHSERMHLNEFDYISMGWNIKCSELCAVKLHLKIYLLWAVYIMKAQHTHIKQLLCTILPLSYQVKGKGNNLCIMDDLWWCSIHAHMMRKLCVDSYWIPDCAMTSITMNFVWCLVMWNT